MGVQRQMIGKQVDVMRQQQGPVAVLHPAGDIRFDHADRPWWTNIASAGLNRRFSLKRGEP
jgi:hypothetical protein